MKRSPEGVHTPSVKELAAAHAMFEANEPRDLFYRAATELVDLALRRATSLTLAEALAVLLQTWNRPFYQYRRFDDHHFRDIERLLVSHLQAILAFRDRGIDDLCSDDEEHVRSILTEFEQLLGPVGAAKCLHLLAPRFFALWDGAIARAYGTPLLRRGQNGERYCRFMRIVQGQCRALSPELGEDQNPLKALDEYNYCRYTKERL